MYTDEQKLAIDTRNCDILVAAAAGSGKTAVLVERIIQMVLDKEKPINIDRLLVVTFTEAAASEMKQRISKAISDKLEEEPDNINLQKQEALLNKSNITTIHSFCLKVVRQNFHMLDIDPSFRIADTTEINLIKQDAINALFEEEYSKEDNEMFYDLIETFSGKIKDDNFQNLILKIHDFSENNPWKEKFLLDSAEKFNIKTIENSDWVEILQDEVNSILNGILFSIEEGIKIANLNEGPFMYIENFEDDRELIKELLKSCNGSFAEMQKAFFSVSFSTLKRVKKGDVVSDFLKEKAQKIRKVEIKDEIKGIQEKFFLGTIQKMNEDILKSYPLLKALSDLTISFSETYSKFKKEKNVVDFNDLERFCLEILVDKNSTEENIIPTKIASDYKNSFDEILIDEYQDSNLIQELILTSVSNREVKNKFLVGDVKQSIYRFRRAQPELFLKKYDDFSSSFNGDNLKIDLFKNFRSRGCVLDTVNFLFYQLMTKDLGDVVYNDKQALFTGAKFPENVNNLNVSSETEVHLIDCNIDEDDEIIEELNAVEIESKIIANRIDELVNSKDCLYVNNNQDGFRKLEYRDIVILVRSMGEFGEILIDELKNKNIPAFANVKGSYFSSLEVQTILSFLQIVDNPRQDIHLLTVLHSQSYSLTSDELLEVRGLNRKATFFDCIKKAMTDENISEEIKNKLSNFFEDLEKWRNLSVYTSINELIQIIYDDTDYFNYVGVMTGGTVRQGNLQSLIEKAIEFEKTSFKTLFQFIRYIEKLQETKTDNDSAKVLSENENLIRIMTIHKSKGLEFPVVFVSSLGKNFNFQDERNNFLLHSDLGFGATYFDLEKRVKSNTISRLAISKKIHKQSLSEELRILYVALTRAKERLILTGTEKKLEDKIKKWSAFFNLEEKEIPKHYMLKGKSYLDFIMPALIRHKDSEVLIDENVLGNEKNKELYNFNCKFKIFKWNQEDIFKADNLEKEESNLLLENLKQISNEKDYSGLKTQIAKKLSWKYPFEKENFPSKISITEIKRLYYEKELGMSSEARDFSQVFEMPDFLTGEKDISPAQMGTVVHSIIEHIDFAYHNSEERILILIDDLIEKNIISLKEKENININKILSFMNSNIVNRINNSTSLKREVPFVMGLTPFEIYQDEKYKNISENLLVHGIIDCYFEENNKIVLLDYKTDYVTENKLNSIIDKYKPQLLVYKKAIEKSENLPVDEALIYFFNINKTVNILKERY